jgi:hypothetical protein
MMIMRRRIRRREMRRGERGEVLLTTTVEGTFSSTPPSGLAASFSLTCRDSRRVRKW